uniref:Uncharacterized protein n=1 Tax=Anguilla anguilla TaxID=7936 RepID=A0A0E9W1G5_ANGAN
MADPVQGPIMSLV